MTAVSSCAFAGALSVVSLIMCLPARFTVSGLGLGTTGSPAFLVATACALLWVWLLISRWGSPVGTTVLALRLSLFLLLVASAVSYWAAIIRLPTAPELASADRILIATTVGAGLSLLLAEHLRDTGRLRILIRAVCYGGAFAATVGLLQFWFSFDYVNFVRIPGLNPDRPIGDTARFTYLRASGTATHPIEFGVLLAVALPFCLHLGLHDASRGARSAAWACAALIIAAIPTTISRTALLGGAVAVAVVAMSWSWDVWRRILPLLLILLYVGTTRSALLPDLAALFSQAGQDPSIQARTRDYVLVAEYWLERPLIGRGIGTLSAPQYEVLDNHYLTALVEGGVGGLATFLGLLIVASVLVRRTYAAAITGSEQAGLAAASGAALAVFVLASATFDLFAFRQAQLLFFWLVGIVGCQYAGVVLRSSVQRAST